MTATRTCLLVVAAVLLACGAFALWLAPPRPVPPYGAQVEPEGGL